MVASNWPGRRASCACAPLRVDEDSGVISAVRVRDASLDRNRMTLPSRAVLSGANTPHPNPPPQGGRDPELRVPPQGGREQEGLGARKLGRRLVSNSEPAGNWTAVRPLGTLVSRGPVITVIPPRGGMSD